MLAGLHGRVKKTAQAYGKRHQYKRASARIFLELAWGWILKIYVRSFTSE
jgi:hypothetical protein